MFQIDDNFLRSVGYDVEHLSGEQKQQYADEMIEELNTRVSERLLERLSDQQIEEFNDVQSNPDRTNRWLREFHPGYQSDQTYRDLVEVMSDEGDARAYYASSLWMKDAIPEYGQIAQEEFDTYHEQLVALRDMADQA